MQEENYPIKRWAKDDRPREKLRSKGADSLADSELIAILLQNGTVGKSAIDLSRELLALAKNNLHAFGRLSYREMMKVKGIGEAKALILTAAIEFGRRRHASQSLDKPVIRDSRDVAQYFQTMLQDHKHEVFAVMFLNRANKINHLEVISEGGITGTVADPRIILRKALEEEAVSLILCHNHPSGNLKPSKADEELTRKIKEASQ